MPVAKGLAQRYHVYAVVMRFSGPAEHKNEDGSLHWGKQWGQDIYDFAKQLGVKRFHYMGKCHGTIPGWWLAKNHPEVLIDFYSFFLGPHTKPANSKVWIDSLSCGNPQKMIKLSIRNIESGLKKKQEEMASLGPTRADHAALFNGGFPE